MDRVFLDANVLFSAAYREAAGLLRLWTISSAKLLSSDYAVAEARRNLTDKVQQDRLTALLAAIEIVPEPPVDQTPPTGVSLAEKDVPILLAAIQGQATHLLRNRRQLDSTIHTSPPSLLGGANGPVADHDFHRDELDGESIRIRAAGCAKSETRRDPSGARLGGDVPKWGSYFALGP